MASFFSKVFTRLSDKTTNADITSAKTKGQKMKAIKEIMILGVLVGCGTNSKEDRCAILKECEAMSGANISSDFVIRGSVNSAFSLTVDGQEYGDIEEYFTAESYRLDKKVAAAGYEGYTARFDAAIGFNDLTQGMTVYIAGKDKRGYQTKTLIAKNDTFAAKLPKEAAGDTYQIRANKRISVILTKGSENKKFCYNFAAIDLEVPYEEIDSPVILSSFKSTLTSYECKQDEGSESIKLPANSDKPIDYSAPTQKTTKVKIYDNLRNLIAPDLSWDELSIELSQANQTGEEHWFDKYAHHIDFKYKSGDGLCEADAESGADCYLLTQDGKIVYQSGIRVEYLAPGVMWKSLKELGIKESGESITL